MLVGSRYKEGQRFGPHYDESVHLDDGCSTEYTLLVYLSGGVGANEATASHTVMADQPLVGGETVFYSSRKRIVAQVTTNTSFVCPCLCNSQNSCIVVEIPNEETSSLCTNI
jgi:hypothetical protein